MNNILQDQDDQNTIKMLYEELMTQQKPKQALDSRVIEQWLNDTLMEAEEHNIPGVLKKDLTQNPITRYGIDRITLTNAGIPNDDVNHLYRSLFVYSVGFFNLMKDLLDKSKNIYLGQEGRVQRHMTKYSVVTAVWKEEHKQQMEEKQKQFDELMISQKKEENQMQEQLTTMKTFIEQQEKEKIQNMQIRLRLEDELAKNQKSHEDEVNLRLKFEEKLNNLHALNRLTNQNLQNTTNQLQALQKTYNELFNQFKIVQTELVQEKVKNSNLEMSYASTTDKVSLQEYDIGEKQKQNERILKELKEAITKYELINYKYEALSKDFQNEHILLEKLVEENKQLVESLNHYKGTFTDQNDKIKILESRIEEITTSNTKYHDELIFFRQQYAGFDEINTLKADMITKLKQDNSHYEEQIKQLENDIGEIRAKFNVADQELKTVKEDYKQSVEKMDAINKARQETVISIREKAKMIKQLETKVKEKDDQLNRDMRKIHELENRILDLETNIELIEKEKLGMRIENDQIRRQQMDKIHTLEELSKNEKEMRQNWCDKFEKETKTLSITNVEMMEMKTRVSESDGKIKHLEIELQNEKQMIDSLIRGKKELMHTLNTYIVKCETQENDLFAMREVSKHFEEVKQNEFKDIQYRAYSFELLSRQLEMANEDYISRLANYLEIIMNQRSTILRTAIELDLNKRLIVQFKDKLREKIEHIDTLEDKQRLQDNEIVMCRSSYKLMKAKLAANEEELAKHVKQIEELQLHVQKQKDKKKNYKMLRHQLSDEIKARDDIKDAMQNKIIQATQETKDQEIQCQLRDIKTQQSTIQSPHSSQNPRLVQQQSSYRQTEIDRYEASKLDKARLKQAKREFVLESSKIQNELNSKYELNKATVTSSGNQSQFMKSSNQSPDAQKEVKINISGENNLLQGQKKQVVFAVNQVKFVGELNGKIKKEVSFQSEDVDKDNGKNEPQIIQLQEPNSQSLVLTFQKSVGTQPISSQIETKKQFYSHSSEYVAENQPCEPDLDHTMELTSQIYRPIKQVIVEENDDNNIQKNILRRSFADMKSEERKPLERVISKASSQVKMNDPQRQIKNLLRKAFHER